MTKIQCSTFRLKITYENVENYHKVYTNYYIGENDSFYQKILIKIKLSDKHKLSQTYLSNNPFFEDFITKLKGFIVDMEKGFAEYENDYSVLEYQLDKDKLNWTHWDINNSNNNNSLYINMTNDIRNQFIDELKKYINYFSFG